MAAARFSYSSYESFLHRYNEIVSRYDYDCVQSLGIIERVLFDSEREDLRRLDVESVCQRYAEYAYRARKSLTPWTINSVKKLLLETIGEFIAFAVNPPLYSRRRRALRAA